MFMFKSLIVNYKLNVEVIIITQDKNAMLQSISITITLSNSVKFWLT